MKRKAWFLVLTAFLLAAPGLWAAPQAVLNSLKGKVEIKVPGSKAWVPAVEGQVLSPATTLSTGFDSSVVVVINLTTIQVKPLTRMTIDKLVEESGTVKTSTFLRVGNVSASVKSAEGVKQDFKVQSPYSTASVRGTRFDYNGLKLRVREGIVALILGRPKRETQPVEVVEEAPAEEAPAAEGEAPPAGEPEAAAEEPVAEEPAVEDDFAGAPDIEADPEAFVPVGAGQDAELVLDFTGNEEPPKASRSDDKDSLDADSGSGGAAAPVKKVPTKGGVTLKIQFAP